MATYSEQFTRLRFVAGYIVDRGYDTLQIMMPNRAFASCIGLVAGLVMGGAFSVEFAVIGALMILCTYSSQAVYNNIRDIEGDRINAPERPLASGSHSITYAWTLMGSLILLGYLFAFFSGYLMVLANTLFIAFGLIYSRYTKSRCLLSYFTLVTTHVVLPLAFGYMFGAGLDLKIMAIAAFIYITEVLAISIKDYKDVEGDRSTGVMTLPVVLGPHDSAKLTFAGMCLPLLFSWVPWHVLGVSSLFLIMYLASGAIRAYFSRKLLDDPTPTTATQILKNYRYALMLQMFAWCFS